MIDTSKPMRTKVGHHPVELLRLNFRIAGGTSKPLVLAHYPAGDSVVILYDHCDLVENTPQKMNFARWLVVIKNSRGNIEELMCSFARDAEVKAAAILSGNNPDVVSVHVVRLEGSCEL